ncbi:MAG: hypothetical protein AB8H03_22205 [Saprospiraceae bacterium]
MKKTFLKAILFFAFFAIGLQNASAQYVLTDDATVLLQTEIQSTTDQMANLSTSNKPTQAVYLSNKLNLFTFVKDRISEGATVKDAIFHGVMTQPTGTNNNSGFVSVKPTSKTGGLPVLHQELEDLLAQ